MPHALKQLAHELSGPERLLAVAVVVVVIMSIGSVSRLIAMGRADPQTAHARLGSLGTWWVVMLLILAMALVGPALAIPLFAVVSLVAFREFAALRQETLGSLRVKLLAYSLAILSYLWIWLNCPLAFLLFIPVAAWFVSSVLTILSARPEKFLEIVSQFHWGMIVTTYAPGYALLLWRLPAHAAEPAGPAGCFLFLLLLTETNDIVQALVGRRIGKRKVIPRISPHKTWAGFIGGLLVTMLLAMLLSWWLLGWRPLVAAAAGGLIAVAGLFGDLNISALKRDCGVKDASQLLPGQGGLLDRIDSLSFSAPLFYYFLWWQQGDLLLPLDPTFF